MMYTERHTTNHNRLTLDTKRRKLGGVCAGVARYLDTDPFLIRVGALIALWLVPHVTLLAYGVAYVVLEED